MNAEKPYTRARTLKKKESGIWTVEKKDPKARPQLFARCGGCMKINDVTTNFFGTVIENGKPAYGVSGCAACKFCNRSFNGQKFAGWRMEYSLCYNGKTTFADNMRKLLKVFSKHKSDQFYIYGIHDVRQFDTLGVMRGFFGGHTVNITTRPGGWFDLNGTARSESYKNSTTFQSLEDAVDTAVSFTLNKPNPGHKL